MGGGCRERWEGTDAASAEPTASESRARWRPEARRAAVFTACAAFGIITAFVSLAESKRVKRRTSAELEQISSLGLRQSHEERCIIQQPHR